MIQRCKGCSEPLTQDEIEQPMDDPMICDACVEEREAEELFLTTSDLPWRDPFDDLRLSGPQLGLTRMHRTWPTRR